jgi:hypothetical protein
MGFELNAPGSRNFRLRHNQLSAPVTTATSTPLRPLLPSLVLQCMQVITGLKYIRAQTAAYLLPVMRAEVMAALRAASPSQLKECRVPKDFTLTSFVTGGNFLFSPVSQKVLTACSRLVEKLRPDSQQVQHYATPLVNASHEKHSIKPLP